LSAASTVNDISFWAWVEPGDTATSVELQLSSVGYFGNELFDGTVSLTQSNCFTNNFGFDVCAESGNFAGPQLNAGNYYLTLTNAATADGNPLYWDENSGVGCMSSGCPSSAQENTLGTIPSEAFTLSGGTGTTTTTSGTTPEPSSIMLFGSGILGLAGVLRRKLF
ncbi:MAG: PEP-CTERM sorting domain-containing protein, partial [Candidatus Korobacteraceae bacterium]